MIKACPLDVLGLLCAEGLGRLRPYEGMMNSIKYEEMLMVHMLSTMNEFYTDGVYVSAGQCFMSYCKENAKYF